MIRRLIWLPVLLLLAACGGEAAPTATPPPPTPTPDPAAILRQAAEAMTALESVHFVITRSGGPAYFDAQQSLTFNNAEGDYAAPDAIQALVEVAAPGVVLEINTVALGDEQWITNPLTRRWEMLPPGWGFNPAILFDPAEGWMPLLDENVTAVAPLRSAELNGRRHHLIEATIVGERIRTITAGLAGGEAITAEFWIEPNTLRVARLHFTTATDTEPADWVLDFSAYDAGVTITRPET